MTVTMEKGYTRTVRIFRGVASMVLVEIGVDIYYM